MKRFLPQTLFESWLVEGKAELREGGCVFAGQPSVYPLSPAVHFKRLLSGEDRQSLVSKVKTEAQVAALGGEQLDDAVVFGDTAYQVEPGYIALGPPGEGLEKAPKAESSEADLLAAFLLDKL